ncbi:MAG: hypothetical protein ACE5Q6_07200 [Dehalococcoidia bacterium]
MRRRESPSSGVMTRAGAARIAHKVYIDKIPRADIAEQEHISLATISRAIKFAETHGIIRYVIDVDGNPLIDQSLARRLREMFKLSHAIVINTALSPYPQYGPAEDDRLHHLLGKAVADYLYIAVRDSDSIWTLGGRSTYFAAQHLVTEAHPKNNVHVTPISGRMATQVYDPTMPFAAPSVDADDAAFFLAKAFCSDPQQFHALNRPVASYEEYHHRNSDFGHLFKPDGSLDNPSTICFCGIGRLGGKHMFTRWEDVRLQPISDDIRGLLELLQGYEETIDDESFFPIGDVANRLFLTDEIAEEEVRNSIVKKLGVINKKIVGLTFSQLAMAPMIIANSGGHYKYPAIRTVLRFRKPSGDPFVNVLCTDSYTAEKLLTDGLEATINIADLPGEQEV